MAKITGQNTIGDVLEKHPELLEVLAENLQGQCLGCPMAQVETLADAAEHHGADLEKLLEDLNKKVKGE